MSPEKRTKVLVVEDETSIRNLLSLELKELNCDVVTAEDGIGGLQVLRQQSFDLIITDVRMPGLDGVGLAEAYRKDHPAQKIVFMTGNAADEKLAQALDARRSYCLKKPFVLNDLAKTITRALEDRS